MPIDELEMLEFYVRLFPEQPKDRHVDEPESSYFRPPDNTLIIEQVALSSLCSDENTVLRCTANLLRTVGQPELASAAEEISEFLTSHGEELNRSFEPQYRVLDYVYPIV